ncbi:MAG: hypothetical protein LQ339_004576 [Xanthoria mediterranea]|nr:MAG: hypothetical protein LQ339_004576 [Xanthoria mediterranea]
MGVPSLAQLALAGVISLIAFLGYGPQYLFHHIEPSALNRTQSIVFNILLFCTWVCYARACFTDPGHVPREWGTNGFLDHVSDLDTASLQTRIRRCRKCENDKPPRAHHCKVCQRCIPKMDHHCPWTINCVSHRTFPHFFRFLFYSVTAMLYLEYFLYIRLAILFQNRSLPSYLGPTPIQMIFLFTFTLTNSITLFALAVLLIRNIYTLASNTTTIESWEIERHDTLVRRARSHGGYLDGPDGQKIRLRRQEFPYDIGIYANARQAMGTGIWTWLWPFAATPANEAGLAFETNGFEGEEIRFFLFIECDCGDE